MPTLSLTHARKLWSVAQGLEGAASAADVPGGWMRTIGGVGPYLSMRARCPGTDRTDIDALVARGALRVSPGVRGCIWLVPAADHALALAVAEDAARPKLERELAALGVDADELATLGDAVCAALADGPLRPKGLRDALPDGAVRSLGDAGKKKGHTTTLPATLRLLEFDKRIRRVPPEHRIDTERWLWGLAPDGWVGDAPTTRDARDVALADRYLSWAAPATLDDFLSWSKLPKGRAKAALAATQAEAVTVEGLDAPAYVLPAATQQTLASDSPISLLACLDNLVTLRARVADVAPPHAHDIELVGINNKPVRLADATWLQVRPIAQAGQLIGLWVWDKPNGRLVTHTFATLDAYDKEELETVVADMTRFLQTDFGGDARLHSIDSAKRQAARVARIEALNPGA